MKKKNKIVSKTNKKSAFSDIFNENFYKRIMFVAIIVVVVIFIFMNLNVITDLIKKIIGILSPIITGMILAYLLAPLYNNLVIKITKKRERYIKDESKLAKHAKRLATIICLLFVLLVATGLVFLFVPQLYNSIASFVSRSGGYLTAIKESVNDFKNNVQTDGARNILNQLEKLTQEMITKSSDITQFDFTKIFAGVYNGFYVSLKVILNAFVGLVVMIYALNMQVELCTGTKRILFALFNENVAKKILVEVRFANKVFSGFLVGKIVDSIIIGILCYVCCLIMQMPYTPLISVIVGVTNIIPFFGPFIGAIPSFLIIFLDQPMTWRPYGFLVFILILQQIDGNIIGPKILGDKTGVGSFWVLFSILLFGGLFGFVGMIIAVPLWAIISRLFDQYIVKKLKEKNQPTTVAEYAKLKEKKEK